MTTQRDHKKKKSKLDKGKWIDYAIILVFSVVTLSSVYYYRNKMLNEVVNVDAVVSKKLYEWSGGGVFFPAVFVEYEVDGNFYRGSLKCSKEFYDRVEICDTIGIFASKKDPVIVDWDEWADYRPYKR